MSSPEGPDDDAIRGQALGDGGAVEGHHQGYRSDRPPAQPLRGGPRLALVERHAALQPAHVGDVGLGLLHEQRAVRRPVGEQVDPAARRRLSDLHLGRREPAGPFQPARDVAVQPGVDCVPLPPAIVEVTILRDQPWTEPERFEDLARDDKIEAGCGSGLKPADRRLRGPRAARQLPLRPAGQAPATPDRARDRCRDVTGCKIHRNRRHAPVCSRSDLPAA